MDWRWVAWVGMSGALVTGLHVYLYRRLIRDTTRSVGLRWAGLLGVALLGSSLFLVRPLAALLPSSLVAAYETGAWLWMGLMAYLVLGLLALGLLRRLPRSVPPAPPDPARRLFISRVVAGAAAASSGSLVGYGYWRAFEAPEVTELSITLPRLPRVLDGFTLVQLTDIHVGGAVSRRFVEEMVRRSNALRPDLVAITGDLVDGSVARLGGAVEALRGLRSRHGTWFVTGNHDYYSGDRAWVSALEGFGVGVLRNRRVEVGERGGSFDLVGVDDWSHRRRGGYDLEAALAGRDPERAAVLLAHQPANFEAVARSGIGLQLSGHTHGGQFFPGNLFTPLLWEYDVGHFTSGGAHLYVSRGTGVWGPPLRVGSPPEIVRVILRA